MRFVILWAQAPLSASEHCNVVIDNQISLVFISSLTQLSIDANAQRVSLVQHRLGVTIPHTRHSISRMPASACLPR